ncbi:MAG: hypothetical protein U1E59_00880 [Amaricoccus sp.]
MGEAAMYRLEGSRWHIGQVVRTKGYFTIFREIAGRTGKEIEARLWLPPRPARRRLGAGSDRRSAFAIELRAARHPRFPNGMVGNRRCEDIVKGGHGDDVLQDQRVVWYRRFLRGGEWRPVKVVPAEPADHYPVGSGVPQFRLPERSARVCVVGLFTRDELCPRSLASSL